ncbi:hypothetical protein scyTo_0009883, partial [Scyliorhinus torazame]|nr:hypothetical protein [Scyliorhinus torazame]
METGTAGRETGFQEQTEPRGNQKREGSTSESSGQTGVVAMVTQSTELSEEPPNAQE